ncbi:MAG: tRNA lysidine(34) synthetase TilS [Pseudolactococcus laudensis]
MTPYEKFIKIVDEAHYFDQHQEVLVALSGGLDSMTLFNWLYEARDLLNISLSVAHINHQQRAVSDYEAKALQEKMTDLGIPFYIANYVGSFSEEKARDFRYDFFEKIMEKHHLTALVTAHHKDDLTENFLIRQIRGSRLRHLTGMEAVQTFGEERQGLSLIRPLLDFEKSEFDATDYFEDASNAENDYLRNRVRNLYLPAFEKENPRFSENLAGLTDEIQKAMAIVAYSARAYAAAEKIDLIEFSREIENLQYFILQDYIAKFPALEVSKAQFDELLHIIRREGQYFHAISNDYNFIKDRYHFYIEERSKATEFETALTPYPTGDFQQIDLPATGQIVIRKRQPGDRIQVNGIDKKLRRYFIDNKVALKKRGNPLIVVGDVVYGVLDVVIADLSKSLKHDKMKITLYYREKR